MASTHSASAGQSQAHHDPVKTALWANRSAFASVFAFSAAMSVLGLTTSLYMLQVYDRVLSSRSIDTLFLVTLIAVAAIAVLSVLESLRLRLLMRIGMRFADAISPSVLRAMVAAASQNGGMNLRSGLRDVETIRNFIGSPGFAALMDAPFIVVYLLVLYLLDPIFLVIAVLSGAILVTIAVANQRVTNPPLSHAIQRSMRAQEFADDGLRNADVLEGMGMSRAFIGRWRHQWLEALEVGAIAADRDSKLSALSRGIRQLVYIFLLGAGALLILDYRGSGGVMIAASIIGARALAPIDATVSTWKTIIAIRLARERLIALMTYAPRREEGMRLPSPQGRIQVSGASYAVPGSRKPVLANISFEIAPGELLGIIGPSASGKSTLLRLLIGAWPCSAGAVRLDGADIYAWPRSELSRHIGYLPQDVELFVGTVRENIARMSDGEPDAVSDAAMQAGAHQMILNLPKGYDTQIGDYGHRLSGGQNQRIGITRALFGNPRFVVLDEPNSNLDAEGEEALLKTLASLKATGVTVVLVAHRPSILQNVDKILVLRANGSMEAFGPRAEIMQRFTGRAKQQPSNAVQRPPGAPPPSQPDAPA